MSNYRIIKNINPFHTTFKVQKRAFFGLWYNFNNIDACTTGIYCTYGEAQKAIEMHRAKTITEVLDV